VFDFQNKLKSQKITLNEKQQIFTFALNN